MTKMQPPSRGCVLKPDFFYSLGHTETAAAFARLCVETVLTENHAKKVEGSRLRAAVC